MDSVDLGLHKSTVITPIVNQKLAIDPNKLVLTCCINLIAAKTTFSQDCWLIKRPIAAKTAFKI